MLQTEKNTATDTMGCQERKKDNEEWLDECRQLLEQKNKAYQAYLHTAARAKQPGYQSKINCNRRGT